MKLYLAGNFPALKKPALERRMKEAAIRHGETSYNRMISFFFEKDIHTILDMKREELDASEHREANEDNPNGEAWTGD